MAFSATQYKVIPDSDDRVKTVFYDLYNDKKFGHHTTNQSLQKKLERFRDNMAVDFYNLILEVENYSINDRWVKYKKQIIDFAGKYMLWNQEGEKPIEYLGDQIDFKVYDLIQYMKFDNHLGMFKTITDKAILGLKFDEKELEVIKDWLLGDFEQLKIDSGRYRLAKICSTFLNAGMIRALYEWIYLIQSQLVSVGRCSADDCNKLFIPAVRGKKQLFCSNACRVREYRRKKKAESVVDNNVRL